MCRGAQGVLRWHSTPQPWGTARESSEAAEPYLIPGLITRRACAADKQDLGFRRGSVMLRSRGSRDAAWGLRPPLSAGGLLFKQM